MSIQWSLVLFTAFAGLGAWCFVFVAIDCFAKKAPKATFPAALVAAIASIVGGLCSVTHLGNASRIFNALTHVSAGIWLDMVLIGILIVCIVVFLVLYKREQETAAKIFAVIGAVAGVALSIACGASYMMEARPAWDTIMMPVAYFGTAAAAGSATYLLIVGLTGATEESAKLYGLITGICGIIGAVAVVAYGAVAGAFTSALIWTSVVTLALAAILGFVAMKSASKTKTLAICIVILAVVGAIAFRCAMWTLGEPYMDAFGIAL